ncbi:uncharacterized protein BHQ10_005107 [Talaromyces amestolkiae]|uniref:Uncharacterized protein n=1 Tax=Talaromyces amestolkiae TaxID=1196081 RepID=A0A364KZX6_TALAM|nr:uncharacterized protein BHQ10_005107 [Talaromyces amestolkiae]RAO69095.1 hypothetical protein BHQ10_005107 [Talaromyces amestolkiae]
MARGKANDVNAARTSFAAAGKDYGNNSGSRSYRKFSSFDTQEPLATQFSARPPSRESIASQDGDVGGYTAASSESQEDLATQFHPLNTRQNSFKPAPTETIMSKHAYNKSMLLGLLDRGSRQKPLPEQHSQRSVVESSSRRIRQNPTTGSVASATLNNVRDGRSPFKDSIHGSRPKPSPKQQSQRSASESSSRRTKQTPTPDIGASTTSNNRRDGRPPSEKVINGFRQKSLPERRPSSPNSTTSSNSGTNDVMIPGESKNATSSSQSQRRSISETRSSPRFNKSSEQRVERTDMNLENEVTSFQVQLPSSSENTAPMTENSRKSLDPPEKHSNVTRTRLTEPARKEKSSHRDPWSGMKTLRRRDVVIPAEQEELLERKDCWIPPDIGQPYPQGHVPPTLLREWNTKMTRLFANARKSHASSQKAEPSREQEDEQPSSSKSIPDESESESEAEVPWSPSPPRDLPKSVAPPDSPTRQDHDRELADITEKDINGIADPMDGVDLETQTPLSGSQVDQSNESTHRADISVDDNQGHNSNLSLEPRSTVQSPSVASQNEAVEPSDDSDMETAIPQALLVRSQDIASQIEFSEPPAPSSSIANSAPAGQVQILDTPAAVLRRAAAKRAENALTHSQDWPAQQSSSESNKSSLQPMASSLHNTEGSSGQEHQSQDAQRPLVGDSQITNGDLQGSSLSSHQDSQRLLEYIPESSFRSPGPHTQVRSQHHEHKERAEIDPSPSKTMENRNDLKRKAAEPVDQVTEESPSKRARKLPNRTIDASNIQNTVDVYHDTSNQGIHEYVSLNKDALRVYDMFKRSYPRYAGNFDHFQVLCFDLESLHRRGLLERPLFWDDFIMRHWVDYGTHVQKCISSGEDYESYEDFFCRHFTRPFCRKRNLTPRTLNIVVSSWLGSPLPKSVTVEKGMQTIDDSPVSASVTRHPTLVAEQVSNSTLEKPNTQLATSDVIVEADRPHQANIGVKLSASPKKRSIVVGGGIQVDLQPPTPSHELDGEPEHMRDEGRAVAETPPHAAIVDDDIDHEMRESSPEDSTSEYHDTASVELGLETMEEVLISHQDDEHENNPNTAEARFEQISRMRRDDVQAIQALFTTDIPLSPEEEDANTPLKTWIRDDYNIVSERRRRGGYEVPLDKNGNIVIEEFPRVIDDGNEERVLPPSRRWLWPRQSRNIT